MNPFTPTGFLKIGGVVLILVAILGYIGVIGPSAEQSIFKAAWWFDDAENIAHLALGIVALAAAFFVPANLQRPLVIVLGIVGVLVGLYSFTGRTAFWGANLENPADSLLHLVVGAWALAAGMMGKKESSPVSSGPTMPTGGAM
ncbi:hypothetical protein HYW67_02660 [Candidatus Parcubacteria bacterium]|nr:hypothetical protein [Candidatus Parcubacteria bacterium]